MSMWWYELLSIRLKFGIIAFTIVLIVFILLYLIRPHSGPSGPSVATQSQPYNPLLPIQTATTTPQYPPMPTTVIVLTRSSGCLFYSIDLYTLHIGDKLIVYLSVDIRNTCLENVYLYSIILDNGSYVITVNKWLAMGEKYGFSDKPIIKIDLSTPQGRNKAMEWETGSRHTVAIDYAIDDTEYIAYIEVYSR